jgi:hypothetical protein
MTLVKRKTKAKTKIFAKSKRKNPDRDFKRDLENLVDERVTVRDKHGIFSGRLKYSKDTRKNYYISITDMFASNAFVSFKPSDVKSIFEEDMNIDITLM